MAERSGNRAINQKVAGRFLAMQNYLVSLGKALHPMCLEGMSLYLLLVALDKNVCKMTTILVWTLSGFTLKWECLTEQLILISSLINSEYVHSELSSWMRSILKVNINGTPIHHGTRQQKTSSYLTPLQFELLICVYGESEHILKKHTAVAAKERQLEWKTIACRVNAYMWMQ